MSVSDAQTEGQRNLRMAIGTLKFFKKS